MGLRCHINGNVGVWILRQVIMVLAAICAPALCLAEEITLGAGMAISVDEYLVEIDGEGIKTLLIMGKPSFDPEPFGPVPSDDYVQTVEPLCENLLANSWAAIEQEGISNIRIRWDFSPSQRDEEAAAAGITMTRFHEMRFKITPSRSCEPWPIAAGMEAMEPELPSSFAVRLAYVNTGARRDRLHMTYTTLQPLAEASNDLLERTARELCIIQADHILRRRAEYYPQLAYRSVEITMREPAEGTLPTRSAVVSHIFPVDSARCISGLSDILANAIRGPVDE